MAWNPQLGCAGTRWGCGCQEEAGTSPADPGNRRPAANGGAARHPGRAGSWARRARPENKASHLFLPSFHRQPLSASPRWIVPAFSLLQLFTGSPWCRHAHKERAVAEAVAVPPALPAPLRPRGHSGAIEPAGRACPGPGWAAGVRSPAGILLCTGCGRGILRRGPQKVWARQLCRVWWRECRLT